MDVGSLSVVKVACKGRVSVFLSSYKKMNTVINYKVSIAQFFKVVYGSTENLDLDVLADKFFLEKRDYASDIEAFLVALDCSAPKTVKLRLAAIKTFLIDNDVELSAKFWKKINRRTRGARALTLDKVPSNAELRKILLHCPIHGKALYLTLASSGMRIGETLQLSVDDFDFKHKPVMINIPAKYTKSGNSRYTFISSEASEALQEWLRNRNQYLIAASKKSKLYDKKLEDKRMFPFQKPTAYEIWHHALEHAEQNERDKSTNRRRSHVHVLRKFFRTKLASAISADVVEALMGHESYLTEVYRKYSQEDLAKFYLQGELALLVFTESENLEQLRKDVEAKNTTLQGLTTNLANENLDLRSRLIKLETENKDIKEQLDKVVIKPEDQKMIIEIAELIRSGKAEIKLKPSE